MINAIDTQFGNPGFQAGFDYDGDGDVDAVDIWPNFMNRIDTGPGQILNTSSSLIAYTATLYDAAGRISRRVNADRDATGVLEFTYNYDVAGRVLNETENGALTTYTYDNSDQILTESRFGHAAAYDYTLGNRASVDSTNNAEDRAYVMGVDNRYDSDGLWDYAYSDEGNLIGKSSTSTVDSTVWTYRYNHRNQMTLAERRIDGVHADLRTEYRYDPFGNRVARIVDLDGDGFVGILEQLPASAVASSEWEGYEASNVTALGNWNAWIPSNEVAGETIVATYAYAAAATAVTVYQLTDYNWVTKIEIYDLDASEWAIVWNDQTPLAVAGTVSFPAVRTDKVRVTVDASASSTFEAPVIDAIKLHGTASRPKTQAEGGNAAAVTTLFTLDMWNPAKSVGIGLENTDVYADHVDGSLTSQYLRGDRVDELLGRFDLTTYAGQTIGRKWTLTDNQGSIRAVLSGTASILARTDYDAFGNRKSLTGSASNLEAELGRYQWTGREYDSAAETYDLRGRTYGPDFGRFFQKDPIGFKAGDSILYRYVRNGPTGATDPSGLQGFAPPVRPIPPPAPPVPRPTPVPNYQWPPPPVQQPVPLGQPPRLPPGNPPGRMPNPWQNVIPIPDDNVDPDLLPREGQSFVPSAPRDLVGGGSRRPPGPPAAPPAAPDPDDPRGSIHYGDLDGLQRPTGIRATITRGMIRSGSPADRGILPPGFLGGSANHARGHLLANILGGSGYDARNLVTLAQNPSNTGDMSRIEIQVARAVLRGEVVTYTSTPIYSGDVLVPRGITIQATGDRGLNINVTVINGAFSR